MGVEMKMRSQRGLTLLGVLVTGVIAAFVLVVGFRSVPVINSNASV